MDVDRYFEQIVDPTIADFEANPTSVRHAFLAAVVVFHAIDYIAFPKKSATLRGALFRKHADFATVDRIAHAFKHVATGHADSPNNPPLPASQVIARPPMYWGKSGAYGLSRYNDPVGGVTLDGDRHLDVLSAIKRAAEFLRSIARARAGGDVIRSFAPRCGIHASILD
jgi:hypothetical protein